MDGVNYENGNKAINQNSRKLHIIFSSPENGNDYDDNERKKKEE